ncbi:MAG: aspartate aminotransferase family protein [Pseudohongiellaceae bacterium]|nr:aspartate aminotransferase family protein [Pseudohongiellaceae bacterium]
MTSALMSNYGTPELEFDHGKGSYLYTQDGSAYLDFTSGIAVNCLGHCHPHLIESLNSQAHKSWHTSNLFRIPQAERLAKRLVELSFADRVFFSNSGTEAIEAGFKMMRRYHYSKGNGERVRIIALSQSFHGRTLAPIAASANPAHCEGFLTGDAGFDQVPFGDIEALQAAISDKTAGVILEPIQGEGGIRVASKEYLQQIRELCDSKGILLMFDEVQSGVGRSGHLYAYEASGVVPDLLASAKGLGGGFPIGAVLAKESVAQPMVAGTHGSTFGGNPLATAVGNGVLDIVAKPEFLTQVQQRSTQLQSGLQRICEDYPSIVSKHSGMGLMIGLYCVINNLELNSALTKAKLLTVKAGANSIRLLPPLNVSPQEIDSALDILRQCCEQLSQKK